MTAEADDKKGDLTTSGFAAAGDDLAPAGLALGLPEGASADLSATVVSATNASVGASESVCAAVLEGVRGRRNLGDCTRLPSTSVGTW